MSRISALIIASALALAALASPASADEQAGEATYVLGHEGPDYVDIGTTVRAVLTATGEDGMPLTGLRVRFTRGGPGGQSAASCSVDELSECTTTNELGEAYGYFGVGIDLGVNELRAQVYDSEGALIAEAGPDEITVRNICSFPRGRCSPPPGPQLRGIDQARRDVLKVRASTWKANSTVALLKKAAGMWSTIGRLEVMGDGHRCTFSVRDTNGRARTRYRAVLLFPAPTYGRSITNTVRLR